MAIMYWWLLLVWPVLAGCAWLIRKRRAKKPQADDLLQATPIAHSTYLTELPEYQKELRRYRLWLKITAACVAAGLLTAVMLSARPADATIEAEAQYNRDIMLCLDVSGSMQGVDIQLVDLFSNLVRNFKGQRFGMVIFDSSPQSIVPLTDDYDLIEQQLTAAKTGLQNVKSGKSYDFVDGAQSGYERGSSLTGDGTASCVQHLGANPTHRSQSVILATDNEVAGEPIVSFPQAIGFAKKQNVRIYAIDPGASADSYGAEDPQHAELKNLSKQTGGDYYSLKDRQTVSSIISKISAQEAGYFGGKPQLSVSDRPRWFIVAAAVFVAAVITLRWRLRL